jgi:hypothetical protein
MNKFAIWLHCIVTIVNDNILHSWKKQIDWMLHIITSKITMWGNAFVNGVDIIIPQCTYTLTHFYY